MSRMDSDIENNTMIMWTCKNNHTEWLLDIVHIPNCTICGSVMTRDPILKYWFECSDCKINWWYDNYVWTEYGTPISKCSLCKKKVYSNQHRLNTTKEEYFAEKLFENYQRPIKIQVLDDN
jgi:hypothetical protein